MTKPLVSVVIETITSRFTPVTESLATDLDRPLAALACQTWPAERIETIVVLDREVTADEVATIRARHPNVVIVFSGNSYLAAKNAGAAASHGELIALLDGDSAPVPEWLEVLISRLDDPAVGAVAGRTRYVEGSLLARTFSVPVFAYVYGGKDDAATGFNLNNVVFRREVLLSHPLEERIRRNGGCYFQFHQLRADGIRVIYEPRAGVAHLLDFSGAGFVRKHFERGRDGVTVYRLDDRAVLRGTRLFRRTGAFGLIAIHARRVVVDWMRMLRYRRQIGVELITFPYLAAVVVMLRSIELAGALTAMVRPQALR